MAIAGLHNVSAFSPFFVWSTRPRSQASPLLQRWRDLEGDHVVSDSDCPRRQRDVLESENLSVSTSVPLLSDNRNEISEDADETENHYVVGSNTEHEDNNSVIAKQSCDLGELGGDRVRQVFRDWNNNSSKVQCANKLQGNCPRPLCLGENECNRVRIIREWVQKNAQPRNGGQSMSNDDVGVESPIAQVCDGLAISHDVTGARRSFRRVYGRHTFLDFLMRVQCERKSELEHLLERRLVSKFNHRTRIQAHLRGRFLRNERLRPDKMPPSLAVTELGLLRERNAFSVLREGFLSKLDSPASPSIYSVVSESFSTDADTGELESTRSGRDSDGICTISGSKRAAIQKTADYLVLLKDKNDQISPSIEGSQQELSPGVESSLGRAEVNSPVIPESMLDAEVIEDCEPHGLCQESHDFRDNASHALEVTDHAIDLERNTASANLWFQETSDSDILEQEQTQESHEHLPGHDFQEAVDNWLDIPSTAVGAFVDDDDDDSRGMELRELFGRRQVSGLLESSFRESLDRVLHSHAERLAHNFENWDQDDEPSPSLVEQDQELQDIDQDYPLSNAPTSETLWDEESHDENLSLDNSSQQREKDQDMINELRVDMAVLQERMESMKSMLEACMDMQMELQRSVRQEVSAALNRSTSAIDASEENTRHDEISWDHVRRGICCLCCQSNINSLLYRCGHMCTCSKCAEKLVQDTGTCPMCRAPVVEAVQAYFSH